MLMGRRMNVSEREEGDWPRRLIALAAMRVHPRRHERTEGLMASHGDT
jgi:hypothetical protein